VTADTLQVFTVQANGLRFACLGAGQGPLVLCLHGFPDTAHSFEPLLGALAGAGYRAVAPFMRGYAPSGLAPDGDYRTTTLGADVLALIEALGAEQAVLIGHDWGALAAYVASVTAPHRVSRLVMASIPHPRRILWWPGFRQLWRSRYIGLFQLSRWPERRIRAADFAWLHGLIRAWSPGWAFTPADLAPVQAVLSDPRCLAAALAYYRQLPRTLRQSAHLLRRPVSVPALSLHGAQDGCMGAELFTGQEPFFTLPLTRVTLPDAGHFLFHEAPASTERCLLDFLRA
jgi:pimeloyl-ACP methyl ester carboxylesterase